MPGARSCCDTYPPEPHAKDCESVTGALVHVGASERMNGDMLLSSNDVQLWSLVQHVLLTWNTLVFVKNQPFDVPRQMPGLVTFYVPRDATFCGEIVTYLEREGRRFKFDGVAAADDRGYPRIPATHVEVVTCSAMLPYIDIEESEKITREMLSTVLQRLKAKEDDPVTAAIKKERAEVDELLAKRQAECFCTLEKHDSPCQECMEISRVRGMLDARANPRKAKA